MEWMSRQVKWFLIFTLATAIFFTGNMQEASAFSEQVIQKGAVGEDVIELQARLQYNGYYNGEIDGVYGWGTYWAVRNFQEAFGMEIDGLVGEETKHMLEKATKYNKQFVKKNIRNDRDFTHYGGTGLDKQSGPKDNPQGSEKAPSTDPKKGQGTGKSGDPGAGKAGDKGAAHKDEQPSDPGTNQAPTPNTGEGDTEEAPPPDQGSETETQQEQQPNKPTASNTPNGFSQNDIQVMSNAVYGEARGEPYEGQVAVAAVILNRVDSPQFPNTAAGVIFEPGAFTAVADGQIYLTPNETARQAVLDAINGWDPSEGALYYFNPETATSNWIWSRPQIKRIGKHIFGE
ncbi:cell wall hydrolase [Bacillus fonticola]|uniref:cell wall hydrolase n=1 Tax=Bacillus fonticola TaxID=2728853 RepID=UPI003899058A